MKTYNIEEAAKFLHISPDSMLDLAGSGEVPGAKIGRAWVFADEDLADYLRREVKKQTADRRGEKLVPEIFDTVAMTRPARRKPMAPPPLNS